MRLLAGDGGGRSSASLAARMSRKRSGATGTTMYAGRAYSVTSTSYAWQKLPVLMGRGGMKLHSPKRMMADSPPVSLYDRVIPNTWYTTQRVCHWGTSDGVELLDDDDDRVAWAG